MTRLTDPNEPDPNANQFAGMTPEQIGDFRKRQQEVAALITAEIRDIWAKIGGPASLTGAKAGTRMLHRFVDLSVRAWRGVGNRVEELKQIGVRASGVANMVWNAHQVTTYDAMRRETAMHAAFTRLAEGINSPDVTSVDAVRIFAENMAELHAPDEAAMVERAQAIAQELIEGTDFPEGYKNPAVAVQDHVNDLIREHQAGIGERLGPHLVREETEQ